MSEKKRRAYIIGQTKGPEARNNFEEAEKFLRNFDLEVFNPESFERYITGFTKEETEIEDFKNRYLVECDVVYILRDWERCPEAVREVNIARRNKLDIAYQQWD